MMHRTLRNGVLLYFLFSSLAVQAQSDRIIWSEIPLSKTDFRSKTHTVSGEYSRTSARSTILGYIYSGIAMDYELVDQHLHLEVKALMKPDQSWLLDPNDEATLRHEQCHFDITELAARELRANLEDVKSVAAAEAAYAKTMRQLKTEQKKFDRDNREENGVSEEWMTYLRDELQRTQRYADQRVDVDLPRK